jgi:hypothetical protein
MFKGLTKTIGLLLFLLFISGTILVPALHQAHCEDHSVSGSDTHCPICQLGNTPCITPISLDTLNVGQIVVECVQLEIPMFVSTPPRSPSQARAPPVV